MANANEVIGDAEDIGSLDAGYTGASSRMFANEKLADKNRKKRALEARRASLPKGVKGLVADMQAVLDTARADNDSFGSYLRTMFAPGSAHNAKADDFKIEFRARELNLELIERMQRCVNQHKMPNNQ